MASYVIHLIVASEINKVIKKDNNDLLIGSIAPDLWKLIDEDKMKGHFLDKRDNIPNLERFINKYKSFFNNDFVIGYYIHLYTDYLWFKYFWPSKYHDGVLIDKNKNLIKCSEREALDNLYNDYGYSNPFLIKDYKLNINNLDENNLKNTIIDEIPISKISILMDKVKLFCSKEKNQENYIISINELEKFINDSKDIILKDLLTLIK